MRLSVLLALAALTGLAACDSAKMSELTGAKPAAQTVAIGGRPAVTGPATGTGACPPSPQPACPPAQPAMAPEAPKAALPAAAAGTHVKHWAKPRHIAWRAGHAARPTRAPAHARERVIVKKIVVIREVAAPTAHRNAYATGYVERHYERQFVTPPPPAYGPPPPAYRAPPPAYARDEYDRRAQTYERRDSYDGRAQGYGREEHYERVVPPHGVYVEEHRDDRYGGHQSSSYQRSESERETYSYRESGSASGSGGYGARGDDCGCQTQAAGRDRRGFLTWPGKQP